MGAKGRFEPAWLAKASAGHWHRLPETAVCRICHDTRNIKSGDLYVAIRGVRVDGHRLVEEAFRRGAVAAMVDTAYMAEFQKRAPSPLLVVSETLPALRGLAAMHRHRSGAWITGITGSMGKTTVKDMTAALLDGAGPTISTQGNWNNHIGLPLSMLALQRDTRFGVFEVGMSHPGEIGCLSETLAPDWGVVTSIGPVHLESFESVEDIAHEKAKLLRALPPTGLAFLHAGDAYFSLLREAARCPVRTMAIDSGVDADLVLEHKRGHLQVRMRDAGAGVDIPRPVAGRHNMVNAGLAMLVARAAGVSWDLIRQGFSRYQPPPMRWEMQVYDGYTVINDAYNANPVSMQAALETFAQTRVKRRKWLVLGDMLELGRHAQKAHADLGGWVAAGPWAGFAAVGIHGQVVRRAALEAGFPRQNVGVFHTAQEAGDWLFPQLASGDAVLLKGSRGVQLEKMLSRLQVKSDT